MLNMGDTSHKIAHKPLGHSKKGVNQHKPKLEYLKHYSFVKKYIRIQNENNSAQFPSETQIG